MEIGLLGPVEVWRDGQRLRLPGRQHRLVLGLLALQANELVSYDRLADLLWGDRPPQRPRAVLQTRVSELRASLAEVPDGELRLLTRDDGYVLTIAPELVDSYRFMAVSRDWRRMEEGEARRCLREVLGLWRGPVLGGGLSDEAYRSLCLNLELARLTATEDLYDLELQAGGHAQVVDEVVGLAAANPTRERLLVQAMRALQRTGRAAEALQTYDRARRWLSEELGVDPGGEAQKVYLALLHDEPAVEADGAAGWVEPSPADSDQRPEAPPVSDQRPEAGPPVGADPEFEAEVPRILPPDIPDFTGREAETARLMSLLTRQENGAMDQLSPPRSPRPLIAVTGRGGVGKTALAIHVAHRLVPEYPDGQLYINLRGFDRATPVEPADALGRFLRALGVDGAAVPERVEERTDLYRQLLADRRVLVVLDNAAADDDQVAPLIPGGQRCSVIITSRARVGTELGAEVVKLDPLEAADAGALLGRIVGADRATAEPDATSELSRLCGHLPLAIRVVAGRLATKPHWSAEKIAGKLRDERRRLDELSHGSLDVRASIMLSYRGLSEDAKRLLCRLGDLDPPEVSVWIAAALLDTTCAHAEEILEQLLDAQLLVVSSHEDNGDVRCRLHDLVRLFAQERAAADDGQDELREARGRAYAAWLSMADMIHERIQEVDDYRIKHSQAPRWLFDRTYLISLSPRPLQWFETERLAVIATVERASRDARYDVVWDLACTMSPFFRELRYFDDWSRLLAPALRVARDCGDPLGLGSTLYRLGSLLTNNLEHQRAWGVFQQAAEQFRLANDSHGVAVATACTAMVERFEGKNDAALRRYHEVVPMLQKSRDRRGEGLVMRGMGQAYMELGKYDEAEIYCSRAVALYSEAGAEKGLAATQLWQGMLRLRQRRYIDAEAILTDVLTTCRRLGNRSGEAQALRGLGLTYMYRGELDRARSTLEAALDLVAGPRPTLVENYIRRDLESLRATSHPDATGSL